MKKIIGILLIALILCSYCFAMPETISALINKKITVKFGNNRNEYGGVSDFNGEIVEWYPIIEYEYENFRFFAPSDVDSSEYDHYKNEVFPISYEGTTYLPIRAISGIMNTGIKWDGGTKSIYIGKDQGENDYRAIGTEQREQDAGESLRVNVIKNDEIKIYYEGKLQTFKDANGKVVYPISYQGTTYLPLRAVSNLFDLMIEWDGNTNTIILKKKSQKKPFVDEEIDKIAVKYYSDAELEILLNTFFADYGHDFDTDRLEDYFMQTSWYEKVEGKKVAFTDLSDNQQNLVNQIKNEIERRKTFKDINTIPQPDVTNISNLKIADVSKNGVGEYYTSIYDSSQASLKAQYTDSAVSKVELLPSKVYLMDDKVRYYYVYNDETFYIPVEKVNSKDKEKIVLMDNNIEIYRNGDLVFNNIKDPDFFNTRLLKEKPIPNEAKNGDYDLFNFLLSKTPIKYDMSLHRYIGYKYNFDNDTETLEYAFKVLDTDSEAGQTFIDESTKCLFVGSDKKSLQIAQYKDLDLDKNVDGYANIYRKTANYDWDNIDFDSDYKVKYYAISHLGNYVNENFVDAYYLYIPGHGFELINKDLAGNYILLDDYIFTLKKGTKFFSQERYPDNLNIYENLLENKDYKNIWGIYNEDDFDDDSPEFSKTGFKTLTIDKDVKVRIVDAEGWWYIAFESEDGNDLYYIYFTPAGVT